MGRAAVILTERQREVLGGVRRGLSNKEIADELGITEDGVKAHLSRLYLRFNVTNRVELLAATGAIVTTDRELSVGGSLGALRAIARRTDQRLVALESTPPVDGTRAPSLAALRDALTAVDAALGLVSELPPETTGPVIEAVRKRLAQAFTMLDDALHAGGAPRTA